MKRRGVLALLTPLLAGCFGGGAVRKTAEPGRTETAAATPTATPEPTGTPTSEATETATVTPESTPASTGDEGLAADHLGTARERVGTAVDAYADGGALTEVRADADGFAPDDVYVALTRANAAVGRAAALAATDEQETAVARLEGVVAFLSHATAAQANAIAGHDALVGARRTLADDSGTGTNGHLGEIRTARDAIRDAVSSLESGSDPSDATAVDAFGADAYRTKVEQFDAAATTLDDATGPVSTLSDGLVLLETARTRSENGDEESAKEDAEEAVEKLEAAEGTLEDLVDGLPDAAATFESPLSALRDLAAEKRAEAESLT